MLSSLNAGHNLSPRPVYWRQWNEKRFDEDVIPFFKAFLRTCYSKCAILSTFSIALLTLRPLADNEKAAAALPAFSLDGAAHLFDGDTLEFEGEASDDGASSSDCESDSDVSSIDSDIPQAQVPKQRGNGRAAGAAQEEEADAAKKRKRPNTGPGAAPHKTFKGGTSAGSAVVRPSVVAAAGSAAVRPSVVAATGSTAVRPSTSRPSRST